MQKSLGYIKLQTQNCATVWHYYPYYQASILFGDLRDMSFTAFFLFITNIRFVTLHQNKKNKAEYKVADKSEQMIITAAAALGSDFDSTQSCFKQTHILSFLKCVR